MPRVEAARRRTKRSATERSASPSATSGSGWRPATPSWRGRTRPAQSLGCGATPRWRPSLRWRLRTLARSPSASVRSGWSTAISSSGWTLTRAGRGRRSPSGRALATSPSKQLVGSNEDDDVSARSFSAMSRRSRSARSRGDRTGRGRAGSSAPRGQRPRIDDDVRVTGEVPVGTARTPIEVARSRSGSSTTGRQL